MIQSHTYRRKKSGGINIDPDKMDTWRSGVAMRIMRKGRGRIKRQDAWQLAAIPAFFLWLFRGPIGFFKRKKVDRKIRHKLDKSNSNRTGDK